MKKLIVMFSLVSIVLVGCGSKESSSNKNGEIIIDHAFGQTVLESKPEKIVSIHWGNQDVALALGVAPVGVSKANYGVSSEEDLLPWTAEKFEELGGKPVIFDDVDGLDFEKIAAQNPDLILAGYSGITQEDYDLLSEIAPVAAYKEGPWMTSWREQITINSTAMGLEEEGNELISDLEDKIDDALSQYDAIEGKTAAFVWINPSDTSSFYVYTSSDPRGAYLEDLGLVFPSSINDLTANSNDFYITLSSEQAEVLNDIDILITYGDEQTISALQKNKLFKNINAVKNESIVVLEDNSALAASTTPSALSIPYTIDEYAKLINEAALKVK